MTHPTPPPQRTLGEAATAFLARKEIEQAAAMAKVDADTFGVNFHLLQVWDMISLYICQNETLTPYVIDPVPVGYAGKPQWTQGPIAVLIAAKKCITFWLQ